MSDSERTHEIPAVSDAPPGTLVFGLSDAPYRQRVSIRLRLADGCELQVNDQPGTGSVALDVFGPDDGPVITASMNDREVHRLLLALRSAQSVGS